MQTKTPNIETLERGAKAGDDHARIDLANALLAAHGMGEPEHERGLALLKQAAEGPLGPEAQWLLGAYFLQVAARPGAKTDAVHWLRRAADAGMAPAIDRLADIQLRGWGLPYAPGKALELQQLLAARGFQRAAWETGYLLSQREDADSATAAATAFARACALGYPPAYYSLGLRFARGAGVARDLAFARALLLRAADAQFPDARAAADELAPEDECGQAAAQWHARLKANLDAAQELLARLVPSDSPATDRVDPRVPPLEAHFAAVGHPALRIADDGRLQVARGGGESLRAHAQPWDWLAQRPRVGLSRQFASREECAHLINKVADSLAPAQQYRRAGANDDSEVIHFSGTGRPLNAIHADSVVRVMERRIAGMTDWRIDALEPCSIIRYQPQQEYHSHVDFFSDEQIELNRTEKLDFGGQRIATFLLYLRAPELGGETVYEHINAPVRGEPGLGVLHYNVTAEGKQDQTSVHTGRPVQRGEKWLWRCTLREHDLYGAVEE